MTSLTRLTASDTQHLQRAEFLGENGATCKAAANPVPRVFRASRSRMLRAGTVVHCDRGHPRWPGDDRRCCSASFGQCSSTGASGRGGAAGHPRRCPAPLSSRRPAAAPRRGSRTWVPAGATQVTKLTRAHIFRVHAPHWPGRNTQHERQLRPTKVGHATSGRVLHRACSTRAVPA